MLYVLPATYAAVARHGVFNWYPLHGKLDPIEAKILSVANISWDALEYQLTIGEQWAGHRIIDVSVIILRIKFAAKRVWPTQLHMSGCEPYDRQKTTDRLREHLDSMKNE
jgi:hypothetical protein